MFRNDTKQTAQGFALVIVAAVCWGLSGAFGQFLFENRGVNTEWLVTVRLLLSGLILLTVSSAGASQSIWSIWKNKADAGQLVLFSLLGMLAVQYTYFAAIRASNAATATVLQYLGPVLISAYLAVYHRRWPRPAEGLAILLAVTGTFLLVTHGSFGTLQISGVALFWGLASAVTLAFYTLQPIKLLHRYPATLVTGWGMLLGGLAFSLVHAPWKVEGQWDRYTFLFTAFIILFASVMAFCAYLLAVKRIGAQKSSLLASVEPLSAALIAVAWLEVPFEAIDWVGCLCIVATIILLAVPRKQKIPAAHSTKQEPVHAVSPKTADAQVA
ncbi:EamA family transporter [Paraflavisolibacter sp. H34]|uniref:DMT family transporter n=1 Tax=Huijunlia imazamoxiresistens TaxID=3127457 RepID=UPI003017DAE1